mmetsp:Transcript_1927/g.2756  ORF Transcript_1927/g.2756 Transcript_1927/m.2756 type:complete len:149 (-) Transcript_1927:293-739(-)
MVKLLSQVEDKEDKLHLSRHFKERPFSYEASRRLLNFKSEEPSAKNCRKMGNTSSKEEKHEIWKNSLESGFTLKTPTKQNAEPYFNLERRSPWKFNSGKKIIRILQRFQELKQQKMSISNQGLLILDALMYTYAPTHGRISEKSQHFK